MTNVSNISGLIGTEDYLIPYTRTSTAAGIEITPIWSKTNFNGADTTAIPTAGIVPIAVTLNGTTDTWEYKSMSTTFTPVGTSATGIEEKLEVDSTSYAVFTVGCYYLTEKEYIYVTGKYISGSDYIIECKRGLLGTTVATLSGSKTVYVLNTIELSSNTSGTYSTGSGFVIYKEMPRNLGLGQPKYPAVDYHN